MEKGCDNSSSGFSVLDKKTSSNGDFLQQSTSSSTTTQPFPSKFLMMGAHHHQTHPFLGDDDGGGGGETAAGGAVGPTNNSGGATEAAVGTIYRDQVQVSSSDGGGAGNTTILQPFDIFHPPYSYSTTPYKSPGGGMATGFPFTAGQWKELERQAMIYKCMISSVPVPHHLLFPLSTNFPVDSLYGGRYSRKGDPEPGRCKRTDGKKWRCSREVAPLQKYCERHLHRGRPRSRKPVELKNNNNNAQNHKKTRLEQTKSTPPTAAASVSHQFVAANEPLKAKTDLTISTPYYKATTNRDLGSKQPWENLMEANMEISDHYSSSFDQDYAVQQQQALNLFSYPNFPAPEMELPTRFIDANWSIDHNATVSTSEGDLSPSLNLSMATAVGPAVSWEPFARGGPLGEALQPASPYNSISTPATTVSSPSGVLHWTLFSHSDGSVCNSPTFAAEISNQWAHLE